MRLHHGMTVPAPTDDVWRALGEIDEIAPCLPGASVERVDEDTVYGSMTVKVGPITVAYKGRAVIDERDDAGHRMVVHASGREQRGVGTAQATLVVAVHEQPSGATEVDVDTDLIVTGRPAQFGRGVMADIGDRVVAEFADRLSRQLAAHASAPPEAAAPATAPAATPGVAVPGAASDWAAPAASRSGAPAAAVPEAPLPQAGRDEPLDLGPVMIPLLQRTALLAAIAMALTLLARALRRRARRRA